MALKKKDEYELVARVYGLLASGSDDADIMDELGLTTDDYQSVKITMFDMKAEELRKKPKEHIYIDYLIQQEANIRALTQILKDHKDSNQPNALVGAVRARSEILDKIIKTGQDVGLIEREPDKHQVISGVMVANLSNLELKKGITEVIVGLDALVGEFGDKTLQDVEIKEIYSGPKGKENPKEEDE